MKIYAVLGKICESGKTCGWESKMRQIGRVVECCVRDLYFGF